MLHAASLAFALVTSLAPEPFPRPPDFAQSSGWLGADGASSIDLGAGRILWLFGDTFVGTLKPDGACAEGTMMVNNTIAVQSFESARSRRMEFLWGPTRDAAPTAWALSPGGNDHWMWPGGGGVIIGDGDDARLVLFFMMMRRREQNSDSVWNFQVHGTATVTVANPADPPRMWRTSVHLLRDHEPSLDAGASVRLITWGPFAMRDPDNPARVLVYGVDVSTVHDKQLVLARAPGASLEDFSTWEFRAADGWSPREQDAVSIARGAVDEFSVSRVRLAGHPRYLLTQMAPNLGHHLQVRFADRPEGPWSDGISIYECPEPAADKRSFVYSGKAHPELSDASGLLMTYCTNSSDFWHVVGHVALYRPRVVTIAWDVLAQHAQAAEAANSKDLP